MPSNQITSHPQHIILIVDDDANICESLKDILTFEGFNCVLANDGKEALEIINQQRIDLMLLDIRLPRIDGMEVLKKSISEHSYLPIVMISGQGTIQLAVESTKLGAYDFLEKPLDAERVLITVRNALLTNQLKIQRDKLLTESQLRYKMIGTDSTMQKIFALIDQAANVDSKVLITGESGTGKELVARAIHLNSSRVGNPFIPVNCSAISENLIESELFGHVKGAFTGAISNHLGKFQRANGGTLFLDEVGDMSLMMQAKLLRTIEDNIVEPVGSNKPQEISFRIVCATNKDLRSEIKEGNFREDLYFRINVIPIYLPALRHRHNDIRPLSEFLLQQVCTNEGLPDKRFAENIWPLLMEYDWPGNIRELRNIIERSAVLSNEILIDIPIMHQAMQDGPLNKSDPQREQTLREARAKFEKDFILKTLAAHDGRIQESARSLGIQRSHLWKKMQQYGINR
ncbi:sigma-54-dependent Fis family transcriptional regulator [candidate division KSB1 bacterium]|nr:sigma-54-dependent Fis family transcriptional regulator [candidate division KSB1 bacterium]